MPAPSPALATPEQLAAALAAAQAAERQAFLLRLTDVLRGAGSTQHILEQVSAMLGEYFHVERVGYGHVDEALDVIEYDVCWTANANVPPLLGRFPASAFGQPVIDRLRAGRTVNIANVREHPLTSDSVTIRTSHEVETRAILVVPLFKAGKLRTIVYLNQGPVREWTDREVDLMNEVAERTRELIERGRAEEALRASEAKWRGLFESMGEGFFVAGAVRDASGRMTDFRFIEANPAFERLTGVPVQAALGRPVTEVIPGVQPELIQTYARVVDTGEAAEFEVQIAALGGRWYEARARAIGPDQFSVLFLEITERKNAQLAVGRSEARYRALFESIDEGFCILEMIFDASGRPWDYRFLEVNPAFQRQAGVQGAVIGRTVRQLLPDVDLFYVQTYGQVALTGEPIRFESRAASLGRWFDSFAFRIGEPQEHRVALLFTDITNRKLAEEALLERESDLREAQSLAGIGGWVWDLDSGYVDASPELLRIFGYGPEEQLPAFERQAGVLYPPEDWERLAIAVEAAVKNGTSYSVDLRAFRAGEPIWVIARGAPVAGDNGRIVGLRGTVQDITERKVIEEALRQSDARKDEFIATLAHELRNPLAPIRNGLAILRQSPAGSPASVRARELMERQLSHLVRLVDDLLDVSRVSQGKIALQRTRVPLQDIVHLALETSRPVVEAGAHALVVSLPEQPVLLDADATRMAQVLANLLNNAAKYTPEGGRIELRAERIAADRLAISVSDNGLGIPRDMLDKVFDLFTQVGVAQARSQGGLGIGLSLAKRLVELHDGTIRAASAGERQGSIFLVEIPAIEAERDAGAGAAEGSGVVPGSQEARRILVVDDNVDAAETLAMLLQMDGHQVDVVHHGAAAITVAQTSRPDLVFLDIGLPDTSGYEVARSLRGNPHLDETLLVALTGWGAARDQERARDAGFDGHLTKPVSPEDLARAMRLQRR